MTLVEINEFSTGIRYQINTDGSWVSLGFTGQYMNVTCDSIPHCVKRSIANKEFAVSEGASSNKPAIIGRVVLGGEEGDWSVVAIVSKGWDEMGRSASFYRYFLSQGNDQLPTILAWIEDQKQLPVFNPAQTKSIGQAHSFPGSPINGNIPTEWLTAPIPTLIPASDQYTFEDINALATQKANGKSVCWAFNVESLEEPKKFLVIQAASDRAHHILQKAIANLPRTNPIPIPIDEQALISALKSLIGSSTVRSESLETFVEALANPDIDQDHWEELFNSQGAIKALRQNIYGSQIVNLLILRTLAIPETLSEYLNWLKFDSNLNKRNLNQPIITSLKFQSQLIPLLSNFPQSHSKLTEILQYLKSDYSHLGNLFEKIGDYAQVKLSDNQLAIFYYKISIYITFSTNEKSKKRIVPKKIFEKAFSNQVSPQKLWNLKFYKQVKQPSFVPRKTVIPLMILTFALGVIIGGASGYFLGKSNSSSSGSDSIESSDKETPNLNELDNSSDTQSITELNIPEEKQGEAINKFETDSLTAITKTISDIQESFPEITEEQIIIALIQNLDIEGNNFTNLSDINNPQYEKYRNELINAIYKYQENNGLVADGIISPQGKTINLLKQQLTEKFNSNLAPVQTPELIPFTGE